MNRHYEEPSWPDTLLVWSWAFGPVVGFLVTVAALKWIQKELMGSRQFSQWFRRYPKWKS